MNAKLALRLANFLPALLLVAGVSLHLVAADASVSLSDGALPAQSSSQAKENGLMVLGDGEEKDDLHLSADLPF